MKIKEKRKEPLEIIGWVVFAIAGFLWISAQYLKGEITGQASIMQEILHSAQLTNSYLIFVIGLLFVIAGKINKLAIGNNHE